MASICRLCATLRKIESFVNIHDTSLDICTKLEKCCQLIIPRSNDALPQNVCNECVLILNDCWKFFQKVHESQESLSKIFYISDSNPTNNSNQKFYSQNQSINKGNSNASSSSGHYDNNISSSSDNVNHVQNSEVERLLHNITIIGGNNRMTSGIVHTHSDNDSENDLKIEIAEQLTFEGLDESDFVIAAGTIVDTDNNGVASNCSDNHDLDELHLHNLNDEIHVNDRVHETETTKFVDQTIDQIENQLEEGEYQQVELENNNNLENTDNSTSTTLLSTSLSKSMLMESLNEAELETLGSWIDYNWKCTYCLEFVTENANNLHIHILTEHKEKPFKYVCTDCLKTFDRYYTFINHVKSRHRVQLQLCCDLCSEFCDSASILAEHRSTSHIKEINSEFNRFGTSISYEYDLAYCSICAKAFKNKAALLVHAKGHQPSDQKYKFPCDFCDKIFATKANWKAHHKIHVGLKDFVCALCGKGFVQKANLDEHMLTHSENTPFECEECHRKFKTSERLAKHISVHSDIRPYKCTICGSSFREKDTLRVHSRIHTGEMPYSCDFCGKRFRFRSVLKTHRHQHTGERPYSCLDCNHHFTNWPNYNKHMKRRHGINTTNEQQANSNVNINIEDDVTTSVTTSVSHLSSVPMAITSGTTALPVSSLSPTKGKRISSSSTLPPTATSLSSRRKVVNQTSTRIAQISELSTV